MMTQGFLKQGEINMAVSEDYIVKKFPKAIENGYIVPFFQPVFRTFTEKICSIEALARWIDPELGMLSPADFIPALEKNGLIYELDMSILRQTCAFYRRLIERETPIHSFSVNLSRCDFREKDMYDRIIGILGEYDVPTSAIKLEITEGVMLQEVESFRRLFSLFNEAGFTIWIDDFGSGYSSLNMLQNYNFDFMKFDMLFLKDFSAKNRQVLAPMIFMAQNLGIHTLAEGVETEEQMKFLRSIGCETLQGYYYSKPLSEDDLIKYLDAQPGLYETYEEKIYWEKIGRFNFQRTNPLDTFSAEIDFDDETSDKGASLALVEFSGNEGRFIYVSDVFSERLKELGYESLEEVEDGFKRKKSNRFLTLYRLVMNTISGAAVQELDYIRNGIYYMVRARCLAKTSKKAMLAMQLRTFDAETEVRTAGEMIRYSNALFATYDLVTVFYPDRDASDRLYSNLGIQSYASITDLRRSIRSFCENEVAEEEREKYMRFFDLDTLDERAKKGYVQGFFRMHSTGDYKSIRLSRIENDTERSYLYTIQSVPDKENKESD